MAERGVDDPLRQPCRPDRCQHDLFHARIVQHRVLQLDIGPDAGSGDQLQDLGQQWNAGAGETFLTAGGIQHHEFVRGVILDPAVTVGGSVQSLIVDHHRLPIAAELHVKLQSVGTIVDGTSECSHGVLRCQSAGTSMGPDLNHATLPLLVLSPDPRGGIASSDTVTD